MNAFMNNIDGSQIGMVPGMPFVSPMMLPPPFGPPPGWNQWGGAHPSQIAQHVPSGLAPTTHVVDVNSTQFHAANGAMQAGVGVTKMRPTSKTTTTSTSSPDKRSSHKANKKRETKSKVVKSNIPPKNKTPFQIPQDTTSVVREESFWEDVTPVK